MNEIEVYLHGIGDKIELIRVNEEASIADILKAARSAKLIGDIPEDVLLVFIGDTDEPVGREQRLHHLGVKARSHLICHHCRRIEVSVSYNGAIKTEGFSPTVKVGVVLKWALKAYGLSGHDAAHMVLRVEGSQNDIPNDVHLGAIVPHKHCSLKLYLTKLVRVEG